MDGLIWFGLLAVALMLVFYVLDQRSHWFILAFSDFAPSPAAC
ncbi:MAG: hypothetical protein ABSG26_10415 [Bryobacteraceae bacterium]